MKQFVVSIPPMFQSGSPISDGWMKKLGVCQPKWVPKDVTGRIVSDTKNKGWYILNNMVKSNNYCILLLVLCLKQLTWKSCSSELELFCEAWRCKLQWSGCHPVFFMSIFRSTFPRTSLHMHPWKVFDKHMRLDETKGKVRVPIWVWSD